MSGLVTNSVIPAFHAANPSVLTTGIAEIKGYVDIKLNKQNCFNGTTGRFTAPVNGLYFFYFNMLNAYANVADTRIQFYVNGVGVGRSYITTKPASTWRTFYGMSVFDLNQNDYVSIWLTSLNTALFSDGTHEAFGGYLIG
jgi:hypothetical protein